MADTSAPAWSFEGEYFENCNCTVACPCIFSAEQPFTSTPTEGACEVAFAFHLDSGSFGSTRLDGLNVGLAARTPGPMFDGNWQVALYVDERAGPAQQEALQAIFSGAAGGTMGGFAPLIGQVLGIKSVPIAYATSGKRRSVEIPGIMSLAVGPFPAPWARMWRWSRRNAHPFAPEGWSWRWASPAAPGPTTACAGTTPAGTVTMPRSTGAMADAGMAAIQPSLVNRVPLLERGGRALLISLLLRHARRVGSDPLPGADDGYADGHRPARRRGSVGVPPKRMTSI